MAQLYVKVKMVDERGEIRLLAIVDEPTRLNVDRDPIYVYARLEALTERALRQLHEQALQLDAKTDRGGMRP